MRGGVEQSTARRDSYFTNRDLLTVAVFSGIGGILSTYIGYLGNLLNRLLGVPFGAGQFVAGLHVFWLVFVAGLVRRPGAATLAGLLKGLVELLTGSTHGVAIVLVSLVQGLLVDLGLLVFRRHSMVSYATTGAVATAANVFVFQALYFSGAPISYILLIAGLAFVSGILLAGGFAYQLLDILSQGRRVTGERGGADRQGFAWTRFVVTGVLVMAFAAGAVYYFAAVYEAPWTDPEFAVEGKVDNPGSFSLERFSEDMTTINAELEGQVTHVPAQDYTGVPVARILSEAQPKPGAKTLRVVASDGYEVAFELQEIMNDDEFILIEEGDTLRLIAGNYEGGYWVKQVIRLVVE